MLCWVKTALSIEGDLEAKGNSEKSVPTFVGVENY